MNNKKIHKQAFFFTIINYLGTLIGIVSALFIYPLDFAFSGKIKFIDTLAQLLYPVMLLGASHALIKFSPVLEMYKKRLLFNYSVTSISFIGLLVLIGVFIFDYIGDYKYIYYVYAAFPIAISIAFIELFKKQGQNLQKLAIPTFFEKIIPKIALPIIFLLLLNTFVTEKIGIVYYVLVYLVTLLLIGGYIYKIFKPGFSYKFSTLFEQVSRKEYLTYSLFAFAASLGSLLAFRIDGLFIFNLISEEANGVYSNGVTLAATLQIPAMGLFAIYSPAISEYITSGNLKQLSFDYKRVAKFLFFIGALLYSCIFLAINDLFMLLPTYEALKETIPIINILGFSVLINMATGFNTEIINYSKYYKFNVKTILLLIVLNISLNLYFIYYTSLGIVGVAYASLIAMVLFNCSKLLFIYKKFGLLPFDAAFLKLAVIFIVSGLGIYLLPETNSNIINLFYKVGLSLIINIVAVYKMKLVPQLNERINSFF